MVNVAIVAATGLAATGALAGLLLSRRRKCSQAHSSGPSIVPKGAALASTNPNQISVVSYNVLADAFMGSLTYADPELVAWSYRWPCIQAFLTSCAADVICLQEVDAFSLDTYLSWAAAAGYSHLVQDDTKGGKQVLLLTLFKPHLQLWWQDSRSRALLAVFLFTDTTGATQALYCGNLHLEGSPRKPQERLNQARSTLLSMSKHQTTNGLPPADCHVVLAGDFNSSKAEGVARLLSTGWLPAGYCEAHLPGLVLTPEELSQPYLMHDVYERQPLPFTRKVPVLESSLDFIWASDTMQVVALYWPLASTGLDRKLPGSRTGLPNADHPSDHLPIGVILECLPAGPS